jgi:hypothetical protein
MVVIEASLARSDASPHATIAGRERATRGMLTRFCQALGAAGALTLLSAHLAQADSSSVSGEVAARVGAASTPTDEPNQPLGPGVGLRAGVSLPHLYLGLAGDYWFGGGQSGVSDHALTVAFEGGYSFVIADIVTIRPTMGFGGRDIHTSSPSESAAFFFEPGVTALVQLTARLFVGADLGVMLAAPRYNPCAFAGACGSTPWGAAFLFHFQLGLRF